MRLTRRKLLQAGGLTGAWLLLPVGARAAVGARPATGFAAAARARRLPRWFEANRVQGHTRLQLRTWHDRPEFTQAAAGFKALGAGAFTRHVKSGDEDPWWPTALPLGPDGRPLSDGDRNVVQEIIDDAHGEGLKIIAYYWHMSEASVAKLHRDWICRKPDGRPIKDRRGTYLDITGPYRDVVLTRLLELAGMGADGFYFDHVHLPSEGCWGSPLEDAWKAETGQPPPPRIDDADPLYRRFMDFKAQKIEETFAHWHREVKARYPKVVFIVSTPTIAALTDRETTTRLARIADSAKSEYMHAVRFDKKVFRKNRGVLAEPPAHLRQAVGWTVLRDAADGRPPHIWAGGVPDGNHARAFAASLLTFGCVANMDVWEASLLGGQDQPPGKTPLKGVKAAFALGDAVSPHLAGTRALRWAAVHFGERSRNARGADYLAAWQQVLWPLVGAYKVLAQDGLPVGIVDDDHLERGGLDGYRLLVLPNPDELTGAQRQAVAAFAAGGGTVIENDPAWPWSDPAGTDAAAAALRAAIEPHVASAPVRVTGRPASGYAVSYRHSNRLIVAVTNDFSWVQIQTVNKPVPRDKINPPARRAQGVQVTWREGHGLPERRARRSHGRRLRAIEAVSGARLAVEALDGGYRVSLPTFRFMALLVVTTTR